MPDLEKDEQTPGLPQAHRYGAARPGLAADGHDDRLGDLNQERVFAKSSLVSAITVTPCSLSPDGTLTDAVPVTLPRPGRGDPHPAYVTPIPGVPAAVKQTQQRRIEERLLNVSQLHKVCPCPRARSPRSRISIPRSIAARSSL